MNMKTIWMERIACLWAGVIVAGNFIAPTAKFQAPNLDLPIALEVGRITFRWMFWPEIILAIALIWVGKNWKAALPFTIFLIQRLAVMPSLDARTLARIQGLAVGNSSIHIVYIVLEFAKLMSLVVVFLPTTKAFQTRL